MIDFISFFLYKRKKAASSHHNFASENNKEVWLRGLKRHTANVLNRPGSGGSNPPASAKHGSLAQLDRARRYERRCREFESSTSHETGDLAELAYCTGLENRQTETSQRFESFSLRYIAPWCNGSTADSGSASGGSNPSRATWQGALADVRCMRKTENLLSWFNSTRLHNKTRKCSSG